MCDCRKGLNAAIAALDHSTRMLAAFVFSGSIEVVETHYAKVRAAEARLKGAMGAYRDHLLEGP